MEGVKRTMIEAALKHALEKENKIFDSVSNVFKYLKGPAGLPTNLIYDNADEIEVIWKSLSGIPQTPSSEPLEAPPQNPEAEKTHSGDQVARGIRVPAFDKDAEPVLVIITKPDDGSFGHANTRHCEGVESYINIRTVEQTPLQRNEDGTVIVSWMYTKKHIKHQQIANQTIRYTRCIVLEGEDAEAMQVDILWGTGYEAGITYPPTNASPDPGLSKSIDLPQTLRPQMTVPPTGVPSNDGIASWNLTPSFVQTVYFSSGDRMSMGASPLFQFSAIPYGMGLANNNMSVSGTGHLNGDIMSAASGSGMADHLHTVAPVANSHTFNMNSPNFTGNVVHDTPSGHKGKRKADDEADACIKPKRTTTTHYPSNG